MEFKVSELEVEKNRWCPYSWINHIIITIFGFLYKKYPKKVMWLRKTALFFISNRDKNAIDACIYLDEMFEFSKYGEPLRCIKCGQSKFNEKIIDMLDGRGIVLEKESICSNCNNISGYWAHGSWMY